jgi:hypothetical protein
MNCYQFPIIMPMECQIDKISDIFAEFSVKRMEKICRRGEKD